MLPLERYFGLHCLFSKNRDSSLHNISTVIKAKKSALLQYYYLIYRTYSELVNFHSNVAFSKEEKLFCVAFFYGSGLLSNFLVTSLSLEVCLSLVFHALYIFEKYKLIIL